MIKKARNGMLIWLQTATRDQLLVCKYSNSNQTHPRGWLHTIPLYTCEDKPSKVPRIPQTLMCSWPKEDHRRWLSSFSLSDTCRLLCARFRKHNRYQSPLSLPSHTHHMNPYRKNHNNSKTTVDKITCNANQLHRRRNQHSSVPCRQQTRMCNFIRR